MTLAAIIITIMADKMFLTHRKEGEGESDFCFVFRFYI